jgi:hypothetical protein
MKIEASILSRRDATFTALVPFNFNLPAMVTGELSQLLENYMSSLLRQEHSYIRLVVVRLLSIVYLIKMGLLTKNKWKHF